MCKADVHARVLMPDHVHILATPEHKESISLIMQSISRLHQQGVPQNRYIVGRRHKHSVVHAEEYLLTFYRYIELNPVAANRAGHPADYRWSSFHCNAQGRADAVITGHELYHRLGSAPAERQEAYVRLFDHAIDSKDLKRIENAAEFSMPLGNSRFTEQIERALKRRIGHARRGRPRSKRAGNYE